MNSEQWNERPAGDDLPDSLRAEGWQESDEHHPITEGTPCYRVVYKTLRVAVQDSQLVWPNVRVRFGSGSVSRGGVHLEGSIPGRSSERVILPEYATWARDGPAMTYEPVDRVDPHIRFWADDTQPMFFVEILLDTEDGSPREVLNEGRRKAASLTTLIELTLGRRVLGAVVTEEAGARFDDGHFNRRPGTTEFCWEPQLGVTGVPTSDIQRWAQTVISPWMERPDSERLRFGLASRWYQAATCEPIGPFAFTQFWFALETLAMPDETNIRPLRELVARLTGEAQAEWRTFLGRLNGIRGDIVHGATDEVSSEALDAVSSLAELVLSDFLQVGLDRQVAGLRAARRRFLHESSN